jgi:hypothetical protein
VVLAVLMAAGLASVCGTPPSSTAVKSISVLTISQDNVLFVGDSVAAAVHAFELGAGEPTEDSKSYNLIGIDSKIADALGAPPEQIYIKDLAVHPVTKLAYVGVTRGDGENAIPVVVTVDHSGKVSALDLDGFPSSSHALPNPIDADFEMWNEVKARTLAITDIDAIDGEVIVAGLSNADFASTLYRIPFPFDGTASTSSIEMYHAAHNQNETRAPIRTQAILNLNGKPHVLGGYTCTPLVTIPLEDLKDGAHVTAKTIAELGYGNAPVDVLAYKSMNMFTKQVEEYVMVTNKQRATFVFPLAAITGTLGQASLKPGDLKNAMAGNIIAPPHARVPMAGLMHVADQDMQFITALRRDGESGKLDLVSMRKGVNFRLSDFLSEYMLPGYTYEKGTEPVKQFQDMMKKDEGYL